MIALGIDPGTRRIGYGLVKMEGGATTLIAAGILKIESADDVSAIVETKKEMDKLLKKYKPNVMAVEKIYFAKNEKTALAVAQARGVVLLAGAEHRVKIKEYTPNEVKLGITGYGLADKKAVLKMVRLILREDGLRVIDDASDALALAILSTGDRF